MREQFYFAKLLFAMFTIIWAAQKIFFSIVGSDVENPYVYNMAESIMDFVCVCLLVGSIILYVIIINKIINKQIQDERQ